MHSVIQMLPSKMKEFKNFKWRLLPNLIGRNENPDRSPSEHKTKCVMPRLHVFSLLEKLVEKRIPPAALAGGIRRDESVRNVAITTCWTIAKIGDLSPKLWGSLAYTVTSKCPIMGLMFIIVKI